MMDCHGYIGNTLKAEKLTALYLSEFFVGLMVVLLAWHPTGLVVAVGVTGNCLRHVSDLFNRPVSVFLVSNAIVAAVVVLSSKKGPNGDFCSGSALDDKCEPHTRLPSVRDSPAVEVDDPPPPVPEKKESSTESAPVETIEVEDREESTDARDPRGELIKLDGHDDMCGEESERRGSVDDLSTEEFNRTVEKYIARTKEFLYKERLDEIILISASRKTVDGIVRGT